MPLRQALPLPAVVDPPERRCVILQIPDEPMHISAFWGALELLTRWYGWARDEARLGKDVAYVWRTVIDEARVQFESNNCGGSGAVYRLQLSGCDLILLEDGSAVSTVSLADLNCLKNYATKAELTKALAVQQVQSLVTYAPEVENLFNGYTSSGPVAVDPAWNNGLFRRSGTSRDNFICACTIYAVIVSWYSGYKNELISRIKDDLISGAVEVIKIGLGILATGGLAYQTAVSLPAILNFALGLSSGRNLFAELQLISNADALINTSTAGYLDLENNPETYTGWKARANSSANLNASGLAVKPIMDQMLWNSEEAFIAYLKMRPIVVKLLDQGDPIYSPNHLPNYGNWVLERGSAVSNLYGVEVTKGTVSGNKVSVVTDGSNKVFDVKIQFDRAVTVIQADSYVEWTGTANNVSSVYGLMEFYLNGVVIWSKTYSGLSSTLMPSFNAYGGDGGSKTFDAIRLYRRQNSSSVTTQALWKIKLIGASFPPLNLFRDSVKDAYIGL